MSICTLKNADILGNLEGHRQVQNFVQTQGPGHVQEAPEKALSVTSVWP